MRGLNQFYKTMCAYTMSRTAACLLVGILCAGPIDSTMFGFNTSPMTLPECNARPMNNCGSFSLDKSDCAFLRKYSPSRHRIRRRQADKMVTSTAAARVALPTGPSHGFIITHVNLYCSNYSNDRTANQLPTAQELKAQVAAIRKRSKDRAVSVTLSHAELFSPDLLGPITSQIVRITLNSFNSKRVRLPNITAQIPPLNLTNLLDIKFEDPGILYVMKGHFSSLRNIRVIEFSPRLTGYIEAGTFTDLPNLIFLGLESYGFEASQEKGLEYKAYKKLHCDAENLWLWRWLAANPSLMKDRDLGQVYVIGSLRNEQLLTEHISQKYSICSNVSRH